MRNFDTFRSITGEELKEVNSQIVPRFGIRQKIESGTCQYLSLGRRAYHVTTADGVYISDTELHEIGKIAKRIWGAEIYHMGIKIA